MRISFLPPPLDGTISLGIYDSKGMLVRVLQREAEPEEFVVGNDALSTTWDGRNDAGEPLPPGKYHARGYAVDADAEGVGYFFNDWVTDEDSLRLAQITAIALENGVPLLSVRLADGSERALLCDANGEIMNTGDARPRRDQCDPAQSLAGAVEPISCAIGRDHTRWIIDRLSPGTMEVKQFSASGELLRRLSIPPEEPPPQQIAASLDGESILLLEESASVQRLRSLVLAATRNSPGESSSDWKVQFEKSITAHPALAIANGQPVATGGEPLREKIAVKLQPNPLQKDERATIEVALGYDADGSFLKTIDGLPLQSISETHHLKRIGLAPAGENAIDVLQDDGAVVEQFRVRDLDRMMAFDAGEIELK